MRIASKVPKGDRHVLPSPVDVVESRISVEHGPVIALGLPLHVLLPRAGRLEVRREGQPGLGKRRHCRRTLGSGGNRRGGLPERVEQSQSFVRAGVRKREVPDPSMNSVGTTNPSSDDTVIVAVF